jgi:hypothetical protein
MEMEKKTKVTMLYELMLHESRHKNELLFQLIDFV